MSTGVLAVLMTVFFFICWFGTCFLIAMIGGWRDLARLYTASATDFTGRKWHLAAGRMRGTARYRGALTLGADMRGLYLSVLFPFRPGHPPLFIPWDEIDVREYGGGHIRFEFKQLPGTYLTVSRNLGLGIAGVAQRAIFT